MTTVILFPDCGQRDGKRCRPKRGDYGRGSTKGCWPFQLDGKQYSWEFCG